MALKGRCLFFIVKAVCIQNQALKYNDMIILVSRVLRRDRVIIRANFFSRLVKNALEYEKSHIAILQQTYYFRSTDDLFYLNLI